MIFMQVLCDTHTQITVSPTRFYVTFTFTFALMDRKYLFLYLIFLLNTLIHVGYAWLLMLADDIILLREF